MIAVRTSAVGTPLTDLILAGLNDSSISPPDALGRGSLLNRSQPDAQTSAAPRAKANRAGRTRRSAMAESLLVIAPGGDGWVRSYGPIGEMRAMASAASTGGGEVAGQPCHFERRPKAGAAVIPSGAPKAGAAVIPSGAPKARRRGIAVLPVEGTPRSGRWRF